MNLRVVDDEAMNFAFPSKTFEYANMEIPMVTTRLLEDPEFINNTFLIDEITPQSIADKILEAHSNQERANFMAVKLKAFAIEKFSFDSCSAKMFSFLNKI